jgi:two-component system sensor histidine kinase DesK
MIDSFMVRASPTPWRRRLAWLGWLVWLVFLGYPVSDLASRHFGPAVTVAAAAGLVAFGALFARLMWLAWFTKPPLQRAAPWLAAFAGLGLLQGLWLGGGWDSLFIYLGVACGAILPSRWVVPALISVAAAALLAPKEPGLAHRLGDVVLVIFTGLAMLGARKVVALIGELRRAREELALLAVTEERLRIARDLHDLLGHSLSAVSLQGQVARRLVTVDPAAAIDRITEIETIAQRSLAEVREAVSGYRGQGLAGQLEGARSMLAAAGIELRVHGTPPAEDTSELVWLVREAVTNIVRHSHARACDVFIQASTEAISLEIRNDGGPPPPGWMPGNGLTGLAERLRAAGGALQTRPTVDGFLVACTLPGRDGEGATETPIREGPLAQW